MFPYRPIATTLVLVLVLCPILSVTSAPHIIVIMADDFGWSDYQGHDQTMTTPNLLRMAKHGLTFNNSYMAQACSPSRMSFLTGRYTFRMGNNLQERVLVSKDGKSMPTHMDVFPQLLQDSGYRTHYIGKWHLGFCKKEMTPTYRGFDTFYGSYNGHLGHYDHKSKKGYDMQYNVGKDTSNWGPDWQAKGTHSTTAYSERAVKLIKDHNTTKPLFLLLSYQAVHSPLQYDKNQNLCPDLPEKTEDQKKRKKLCELTAGMDVGIGQVLNAIKNKTGMENHITLFISDNGGSTRFGSSNWPLRGSKKTLWEGGTRVVTIMNSPAHFGQYSEQAVWTGLMHSTDWFPTLLSAAGLQSPQDEEFDGKDNWASIKSNYASQRTEFLYNIYKRRGKIPMGAVRQGQFKLIYKRGGNPDRWDYPPNGTRLPVAEGEMNGDFKMYDLENDPMEEKDISQDDAYETEFKELKDLYQGYNDQVEKAEREIPKSPAPSKAMKEAASPKYHGGAWATGWC